MNIRKLVRLRRFWFVIAILTYTLVGFFVVPRIIRQQALAQIELSLGRIAVIESVRVNPYRLSMSVSGFSLPDEDGTVFIGFDELYVNLELSSVINRAWTVGELRLENPEITARIMPSQETNFEDASVSFRTRMAADEDFRKSLSTPPRMILQRLRINGARLTAVNMAAAEPESLSFTPANLDLHDLSTLPDRSGRYDFEAIGAGGGRWELEGMHSLHPLQASGSFAIQGTRLPEIWNVIRNRVEFEITSGAMGLQVDYAVALEGNEVAFSLSDAALSIDALSVREKGVDPELFSLDSLRVTGAQMQLPAQRAHVERVAIHGADLKAWLSEEGELNWLALVPEIPTGQALLTGERSGPGADDPAQASAADSTEVQASVTPTSSPAGSSEVSPWTVTIAEVALIDAVLHAEDRSTTPTFAVDVDSIDLILRDINTDPGSLFGLELALTIAGQGRLNVNGRASAQPPAAILEVELAQLPLPIFQPYLNSVADLRLVSGSFGLEGQLEFAEGPTPQEPDLRFAGSVSSDEFLTIDRIREDPFVGWRHIEANQIRYDTSHLEIAEIVAERPRGKVHVHADRTTNIDAILAPSTGALTGALTGASTAPSTAASTAGEQQSGADQEPADVAPATTSTPPMPIHIGNLRLIDGWLDFTDESLILPFAAGIDSLSGTISGLSSDPDARAEIALDGDVLPSGRVSVTGQVNPLSEEPFIDIEMLFRDLDLPVLTPYSGQYIGREIDKGKLQLDLEYRLEGTHLVGDNRIILHQLEYGDDVDSPEATSLPVGLATALLKDSRGNIDLEVPIEGDVDDPGFGVGDAIWEALSNTVSKVAMAPFKLLGGLVGMGGGESEELQYVDYLPGESGLQPDEEQQLFKLAEALLERPELSLEIRGYADREVDGLAIRESRFADRVATRVAEDPGRYASTDSAQVSPRLLRDLFDEAYGDDAAERLEDLFQVPRLDDEGQSRGDKTDLDEARFHAHLRQTIVDDIAVPEDRLQQLAIARSAHVKNVLAGPGGVSEFRIFLLDVGIEAELSEDGRVRTEMTVTN